jgi:hypothetical protein
MAVALASCYQPDLGPGKFQCKGDDPCPDGQVCRGGTCRLPEEDHADGGGGGKDGGGVADMARPMVMGCTGNGARVADKVYACRGGFQPGGYKSLCGGGYHVCSVATDGKLLEGVKGCSDGFFVVELAASGRWDSGLQVSCPPQTGSGHFPVLVGCGDEAGVIDKDGRFGACSAVMSMPALRSAVTCGNILELDPWKCRSNLGDTRHEAWGGKGGTLCCQD